MMPSKRWSLLPVFVLTVAVVALPAPGRARLDDHGGHGDHATEPGDDPDHGGHHQDWCGTNRSNLAIALGISHSHHREMFRINRQPVPEEKAAITARSVEAVGDIAVMSDDRVFRHINPLDVAGAGILFTPKAKGYTIANSSAGVADALVTRLDLGDDATAFVPFVKGFKPKFFGKAQGGMFVNSDGNITFGSGDDLSTERGLQRFLLGPGRIAPLFMDLDPTVVSGESGIYVSTSKTLVIVTWLNVAEFGNANRRNTFQVKIEKTGRVTFAYGDLGSREAVTGIAPGDGGAFTLVDFQEELPITLNGAVAEQFSLTESLDDVAVMQVFLESFADRYDSVIVWLDFPYILGGGAFAYEFSVKNDIRGIGQPIFDASRQAGSRGRLSSFVQMGTLGNYPADPNTTFLGTNTTLDVLGQEVGHRWLAFLAVFQAGNPALLGRSFAHWSFFFDSKASDMEGNGIRDNGNGTFTTFEATSRYSQLDQYVMGLRGPSEVEDMFYVANAPGDPGDAPAIGITFPGERRDVRIQDIIAAEGPRVPSSATAPKSFNQAFILVTRAGAGPAAGSVDKLERIRAAWVDYWGPATDGRSTIDTSLVPR